MNRWPIIFKDLLLNEKLAGDGFVIVPFLEEVEVERLQNAFHDEIPRPPDGFYATTHEPDSVFKKRISEAIKNEIAEAGSRWFGQVNLLGGAFISKSPGIKSTLPLHQDWNIVDESLDRSFNIWIPLVDVNEENGAVMVLKGSHNKQETYRGPNLPPVLSGISDEVLKHMITLPMTTGQALIYDHALWHASPENQTKDIRPAAVLGMIPIDARMKFYYKEDRKIEEYHATPDFYLTSNPQEGPVGLEKIRDIPYAQKELSREEFFSIYLEQEVAKTTTNKTIFSKLLKGIKWILGSQY